MPSLLSQVWFKLSVRKFIYFLNKKLVLLVTCAPFLIGEMKKITKSILLLLLSSSAVFSQNNHCGTMESHAYMLANDPDYAIKREAIREHTNQFIESYNPQSGSRSVITIPVVFHVVYQNATENISDAQLLSQLDILNEDFRKLNANFSQTPSAFQGVSADLEIEFCLASIDPQGNATNGITRTQTSTNSFNTNNNVKRDNNGGKSPWNTSKYLNIWVCDLGNSLLGYAQFPGGNPNTDGVVLTYTSVGRPPANPFNSSYNLGRTATHEVGHWLNLYHIWGDDDGACNGSDEVSDTPNQGDANYGCPSFPHVSCNNGPNGDMFMNYMDYMDDDCATMFTNGQKARAQALFSIGGARVGLLTSNACSNQPPPPVTGACADTVNFPFPGSPVIYGDQTTGYVGGTNTYGDLSKADKFTVSNGYNILTNAWFGFSFADAGSVINHQVTFKVWDDNGAGGLPGTVLGSTTLPLSTIISDVNAGFYTEIEFTNPITLSGSYYLGFDVEPASGVTISVYTNTDGDVSVNTAYEQFDDGTWHAYTETASWELTVNHMIHPILQQPSPVATFSVTPGAICAGGEVNFTATSQGAQTYAWTFPGGSPASSTQMNPSVSYNSAGSFGATLTITGGCDNEASSQTNNNVVTVSSPPVPPVVTFNGSQLVVSGANGAIQWYFNGTPINGASGTTWSPSQIGTYSVSASQGGCTTYSNDFLLEALSLENAIAVAPLSVSPNPVSDILSVQTEFLSEQNNVEVQLYDVRGKVVYKQIINVLIPGERIFVPVNELSSGLYLLTINSEKGKSIARVAVAH